jgi:hypothetical protein
MIRMQTHWPLTANDVRSQQEAMSPAHRRATIFNCRMEHRHSLIATPAQLLRLRVLSGGPQPPCHYCERCFTVFDAAGREIPAESA